MLQIMLYENGVIYRNYLEQKKKLINILTRSGLIFKAWFSGTGIAVQIRHILLNASIIFTAMEIIEKTQGQNYIVAVIYSSTRW